MYLLRLSEAWDFDERSMEDFSLSPALLLSPEAEGFVDAI